MTELERLRQDNALLAAAAKMHEHSILWLIHLILGSEIQLEPDAKAHLTKVRETLEDANI